MIKKFSEEASINNLGSVQYDRPQKYMTQKDKDQACENIGLGSSLARNLEEVLFANLPIDSSTLRFSFGNMDYDPTKDTDVASKHNTTDRAGGGTPAGYGGTWKKLNTYFSNVWDYTYLDNTLLNEFDNGNFGYEDPVATRFWTDATNNPIKIIAANTAGCVSFKRAFQGIWALTEIWDMDLSDASEASMAFSYCKNLKKIPKTIDISASTNSIALFQYCFSLENIENIILNTTNNNSLQNFCLGCISLKSIKSELDMSHITSLASAFCLCHSLTELSIKANSTSNVTNFKYSFATCNNLPLSIMNVNTDSGTDFSAMFAGHVSMKSSGHVIYEATVPMNTLVELPSLNLVNATTLEFAFNNCKYLEYIDSNKLNSLKTGANLKEMFLDSTNVKIGLLSTYNLLSTKSPSNNVDTFTNCGVNTESGRLERSFIPQSWGGDMEA